jgi:nucleoside-diphosphate-sugar epimerase/predicted dehydrogenase
MTNVLQGGRANRIRRVGITGAGLISGLHQGGLSRIPSATIVGVVDADTERAKARAADWGVPWFRTQAELLDAERPEVIHVLTPPASHADLCIEALEAGAHVYVEKPMAATESDCESMIETAARCDRRLCVGHSLVHDPLMRRALDAIRTGEVGEILHAAGVYAFDASRIPGYRSKTWYTRLGGGFVEDLAAHPASLLARLLGQPRNTAGVERRNFAGDQSSVTAIVDSERGSGTFHVSLDARPEEVTLEIRTTKALLRIDFIAMVLDVQKSRNVPRKVAPVLRSLSTAGALVTQTAAAGARLAMGRLDTTKGLYSLIAAFYDALDANGPVPVPGEEGRDVVRMIRSVWPALGRPVRAGRGEASGDTTPVAYSSRADDRPLVLVTGATGFIGRHLVRSLVKCQYRVRALVRNPRKAGAIACPDVDVVIGDIAEADAIPALTANVDTIFHLASVMSGSAEEFRRSDVDGTRRLIEVARRDGVRRLVYASTLGVYPFAELDDGATVRHDTPTDSSERIGPYSAAKVEVERMLMDAADRDGLEAVVARLGLVFGPGSDPHLEHLPHVGQRRGNRYVVYGDGNVRLALTYVQNTVDALIRCATVEAAAGETFLIVDDNGPTQREFIARLAHLTGEPLRITAIPRPAIAFLGFGLETASRIRGRKPATTRRLLTGKSHKLRYDASHARHVLGWEPAVGWQDGLQRNVEWWNSMANGGGAP